MDRFYRFQFQDQASVDEEIDALVAQHLSPIADRDGILRFIRYPASFQLNSAGSGIHAFAQPRTKLSVYVDAKTDDFGHQRLEILRKR